MNKFGKLVVVSFAIVSTACGTEDIEDGVEQSDNSLTGVSSANFECRRHDSPSFNIDPFNGDYNDYIWVADISVSQTFSTGDYFRAGIRVTPIHDRNRKPFVFTWNAAKKKASLVDSSGYGKYICSRSYADTVDYGCNGYNCVDKVY